MAMSRTALKVFRHPKKLMDFSSLKSFIYQPFCYKYGQRNHFRAKRVEKMPYLLSFLSKFPTSLSKLKKPEDSIFWGKTKGICKNPQLVVTNCTGYPILRVFCSTIFRQFRQVNCRNSELDENFG